MGSEIRGPGALVSSRLAPSVSFVPDIPVWSSRYPAATLSAARVCFKVSRRRTRKTLLTVTIPTARRKKTWHRAIAVTGPRDDKEAFRCGCARRKDRARAPFAGRVKRTRGAHLSNGFFHRPLGAGSIARRGLVFVVVFLRRSNTSSGISVAAGRESRSWVSHNAQVAARGLVLVRSRVIRTVYIHAHYNECGSFSLARPLFLPTNYESFLLLLKLLINRPAIGGRPGLVIHRRLVLPRRFARSPAAVYAPAE